MEHSRELQYALNVIVAGGSLDVVGRPGSGRSSFVRNVAELTREHGMSPLIVSAIPALQGVPLTALTLAGVTGGTSTRQGAGALAAVYDELVARARTARLVVLIDDWDDLDEPSWGVISAAGRAQRLPVVITRDRGRGDLDRALADPVLASAMTIELGPLSLESMGRRIAAQLQGPVSEETVNLVFAKSGGLLGLALKIVDAAVLDGRVRQGSDGVWEAAGELWSGRLIAAAESLLVSVTRSDRDALAKLALAGFVGIDEAVRLVGSDTLEHLESAQLIASSPSGPGLTIGVSPPLLSEYLNDPQAQDAVRAHRLRNEVEAVLGPLAPSGVDDAEVRTPDSSFVRMVQEQQSAARAFARTEWLQERSAEAGARYLRTLLETGADDTVVESVLGECAQLSASAPVRTDIARLHAEWLAYRRGDTAAAIALLDEQQAALGADGRALDAVRVEVALASGTVPDDETSLTLDDALPVHTLGQLLDARAYLHVIRGQFALALDEWRRSRALDGYVVGYKEDVTGPIALLGLGRTQEALSVASAMYETARARLDVNALRTSAYALSLVLSALGLFRRVGPLVELNQGLGQPQPRLQAEYEAVRQLGDDVPGAARRRSPRELSGGERLQPVLPTGHAWPRARALAQSGELAEAAEALWETALGAWARGAVVAGAVSALTSVEMIPDAGRLAATRAALARIDPGYLSVTLEYAEALAADDPVALRRSADALTALRMIGHAYVACVRAEELLRAAGDIPAAEEVSATRRALMETPEFEDADTGRFLQAPVRLTDREVEIATRAADGATNQAIADALGVSVRTAESHLHRAMRKLGASSRTELAGPLRDYLALRH